MAMPRTPSIAPTRGWARFGLLSVSVAVVVRVRERSPHPVEGRTASRSGPEWVVVPSDGLAEQAQGRPVSRRDGVAPLKEELAAAVGSALPDIIGPGLDVLFCGVNPGLYSGAVGHHFARSGNRFWDALHQAGFTEEIVSPFQDASLLERGIGLTNLVVRATAGAAELTAAELRAGARDLETKVVRLAPRAVVFLGLQAYRTAFGRPAATIGPQPAIGPSAAWLVPNPSGRQARYPLVDIVAGLRAVREALGR